MHYSISIKGVLLVDGKIVLVRNARNEWELPGGRIDLGESPEQTLEREFAEELSIEVCAIDIIDSYMFEVVPSEHVFIVTYGCRLLGNFKPVLSHEHTEFSLYAVSDLSRIPLPAGYARSIKSWSERA